MKAIPARLDADGTAKPLTKLVHHPLPGKLQGPGIPYVDPELEDQDGKRTPLVERPSLDWGRAVNLAIQKHTERFPGSEVYALDVSYRGFDTQTLEVEIQASYFSVSHIYYVSLDFARGIYSINWKE